MKDNRSDLTIPQGAALAILLDHEGLAKALIATEWIECRGGWDIPEILIAGRRSNYDYECSSTKRYYALVAFYAEGNQAENAFYRYAIEGVNP